MTKEHTYTRDFKRMFLRITEKGVGFFCGSTTVDHIAFIYFLSIGFFQMYDFRQLQAFQLRDLRSKSESGTGMDWVPTPPEPG